MIINDQNGLEEAVENFLTRGWSVIPIPEGSKAPNYPGWPSLRITSADIARHFFYPSGIGLLLGDPSGGVVDVDIDHDLGLKLAPMLLPNTGAIFGHDARPSSHYLYRCEGAQSAKFQTQEHGMLVELRCTGQQTILPGSRYSGNKGPRGAPIRFYSDAEPAFIPLADIVAGVADLAVASILASKWVPSVRDDLSTALTGSLLRAHINEARIEKLIQAVASCVDDDDVAERVRKVRYHAVRLSSGDGRTPGWPRLSELIGADNVKCVRDWLGISATGKQSVSDNPIAPAAVAEALLEVEYFARGDGDLLYHFSGGRYVDATRAVKTRVKNYVCNKMQRSGKWSSRIAEEVMRYILADERTRDLWPIPPVDTVNLLNGLLDVTKRELRPHDPSFLSCIQLPVTFDPNADGIYWRKYVADWFPGDAEILAWELVAFFLTPFLSLQKAVYLFNESGRNGKSRFIEGLRSFLGHENVSTISLQTLENERFAAAGLVGKLANFYADLPAKRLASSSMFKSLTGGDCILGERKYGTPFSFKPYARLLFSGNGLPTSDDSSEAFFRRWMVIRFPRTFQQRESVPAHIIDAQLSSSTELSWLLNRALDVIKDVHKRGFSEPESVRAQTAEFQEMTDPFAAWLSKETVANSAGHILINELMEQYNRHAYANNFSPFTKQGFGSAIRKLRPGIKISQVTAGGHRQKCYVGLSLARPSSEF